MKHRPLAARVEAVRTSWHIHEETDPDISTEQLLARVADDTGEDYGDVAALFEGDAP